MPLFSVAKLSNSGLMASDWPSIKNDLNEELTIVTRIMIILTSFLIKVHNGNSLVSVLGDLFFKVQF